ncbi:MAG: NAD(+) diphosphatase [Actinomycetota bacterium]
MEVAFTPIAAPPAESNEDRWLLSRGGQVLLLDDFAEGPRPLTAEEAGQLRDHVAEPLVLGKLEGQTGHWWTGQIADDFDEFECDLPGLIFSDLRSLMARLDPVVWNIAGRATQIVDWYRDNRYCGRCSSPMVMAGEDRSMKCPACGFSSYPRLSPAVIVLVLDDQDRALLARNIAWPMPMYSTLAGFVEPGESLEDCIHREIEEEVGVQVRDIEYFDSQPWPFPNSLMLGFFARFAGGEITPAPDEIADAQWFPRDDLPMIPPHGSIARALIDRWLSEA